MNNIVLVPVSFYTDRKLCMHSIGKHFAKSESECRFPETSAITNWSSTGRVDANMH